MTCCERLNPFGSAPHPRPLQFQVRSLLQLAASAPGTSPRDPSAGAALVAAISRTGIFCACEALNCRCNWVPSPLKSPALTNCAHSYVPAGTGPGPANPGAPLIAGAPSSLSTPDAALEKPSPLPLAFPRLRPAGDNEERQTRQLGEVHT